MRDRHLFSDGCGYVFYAGNSNDGHTIGNMVVINFKGTVRGILLLAVLYVIYLVAKK